MKATIDQDGVLVVSAENTIEALALKHIFPASSVREEHGQIRPSVGMVIDYSILLTEMQKKTAMSPEEFKQKMEQIEEKYKHDIQFKHVNMDNAMANLLCKLGYSDGVDVFMSVKLWYA